jgi:hypothetical protein
MSTSALQGERNLLFACAAHCTSVHRLLIPWFMSCHEVELFRQFARPRARMEPDIQFVSTSLGVDSATNAEDL